MKIYKIATLYVVILMGCFSASANKVDTLVYGKAGGFTGHATVFRVVRRDVDKGGGLIEFKYNEKARLSKRQARKISKLSSEILDLLPQVNQSANTYYFLELSTNGTKHRLIWTEDFKDIPEKLANKIKSIQQIINAIKF